MEGINMIPSEGDELICAHCGKETKATRDMEPWICVEDVVADDVGDWEYYCSEECLKCAFAPFGKLGFKKTNMGIVVDSHLQTVINLECGALDELHVGEWKENRMKSLRRLVDEISEGIQCPNCGGLVPELLLGYKGKTCSFTCTKVTHDGKTIAETDYGQLVNYLQSRPKKA